MMSKQTWLRRYRQRLVERGGLTLETAAAWDPDVELESAPEDVADDEMSYWDEPKGWR